MATYPPRRLLGARPLPSDPRRDPRRSDFPPGGGGRWERRLRTGQSWGWVDCFSRVGEGTRRGASPLRFPPRGPHLLSHQLTGRLVATPQPLQPRNLRCLRARFQGQAARHHHFLRRKPAALSWDIQTAYGEACVPRNKLSQPTRNQSLWTTRLDH
ncbi:uncharacterized protein ACBT57_001663 isoform 4-T4 [Dama dama]